MCVVFLESEILSVTFDIFPNYTCFYKNKP